MSIKLKQTKHGIHTWHSTVDGRFTIKPTQWSPGNEHRPTGYELIDANKPGDPCPLDRLATGRHMIAGILDREARAAAARAGAADDEDTAQMIGAELAVFAGMLFDAGISFNVAGRPGAAKLDGSAAWVERGGRKRKRARVTMELRNEDIVKLAMWLTRKGVKGI